MMKQNVRKRFWLLALMIGGLLLAFQAAQAEPEEPVAPMATDAVTGYPNWKAAVEITKDDYAPNGARLPVVAAARNDTIMVGFLIQTTTDEDMTDLYYRTSTDDGANWSPGIDSMPLPIHTSAARSTELDIVYQGNNAHAVWREGDTEIHFARQNQWASNASLVLSDVGGANAAVYAPRIVASENNRLNVVWGEFNNGQFFLRFRRSLNNGNDGFPISGQLNRANIVARPSMVVAGDTIHLVWEEGILIPGISGARIYYARGTVNEGSNQVTWEGPIAISPISTTPGIIYNAKQPDIVQEGSSLHVTYANRLEVDEQFIGYLECAANCLAAASWQSTSNVSGQFVGVFADDPYDMAPTMGGINGCVMVYFHGILAGDTEQILGTNDCSGWAASAQDIVSPIQNRAINPRLRIHENWWIYLVYQEIQVVQQGGNPEFLPSQIRFVRNDPSVYLPLIRKP